jgi:hypothetical protein
MYSIGCNSSFHLFQTFTLYPILMFILSNSLEIRPTENPVLVTAILSLFFVLTEVYMAQQSTNIFNKSVYILQINCQEWWFEHY